jgi:hypothetical protein
MQEAFYCTSNIMRVLTKYGYAKDDEGGYQKNKIDLDLQKVNSKWPLKVLKYVIKTMIQYDAINYSCQNRKNIQYSLSLYNY